MCFVLYVASRSTPQLVPFDQDRPMFCSQEVSEEDGQALKRKFTLPVVTYLGSDQGCGCGFRHFHADVDVSVEALPDYFITEVDDQHSSQPNHSLLAEYLRAQFASEPFVELFGCWSGDEGQPSRVTKEIQVSNLLDPSFGFHERGLYKVSFKS